MRKRWISLMCLIMETAALWICGKYSKAVGMTADKNKAERTGMENTRLSFGEGEQEESGEDIS